ncbi:MAG: glycoside hydrolase family 43 protein, partial [Mucilaginibacter sp.]
PGKLAWIPPAGQMYSSNIWAPELHYLDGKWYVYFAGDNGNDGNHRMHVLENASDDPTKGTWTYKGKIGDDSNIWAIDGSVFEHGGKRYFMWSGWKFQNGSQSGIQQIYIAEMSNPWTITGARYMISEPTYDWEMVGLVNEGPEILKNAAGDVFLVYSASGCWTDEYKLGMMKLTGTDPLVQANWTKYSTPVFQKNIANSVYSPGHNSFFKSPDGTEDWIIYHANNAAGLGCGGSRSTRMQKFTWNEDGTPNFGVPKSLSESLPAPSGEGL